MNKGYLCVAAIFASCRFYESTRSLFVRNCSEHFTRTFPSPNRHPQPSAPILAHPSDGDERRQASRRSPSPMDASGPARGMGENSQQPGDGRATDLVYRCALPGVVGIVSHEVLTGGGTVEFTPNVACGSSGWRVARATLLRGLFVRSRWPAGGRRAGRATPACSTAAIRHGPSR